MPDYSALDQPSILTYIFYPRKDSTPFPKNAFDLSVPVGDHVSITCRFYIGGRQWPWILFFHGNGEVVSDYDEMASFYHERRLNLGVADYRGYGTSGGVPSLRDLPSDAQAIFEAARRELTGKRLQQSPVDHGAVFREYLCPGAGLSISGQYPGPHH